MTDHDEAAALAAWRSAIAATTEAERTERLYRHRADLQGAVRIAEDNERRAGRRYLAARDASVAAQGTCSDHGRGVADFAGDANAS